MHLLTDSTCSTTETGKTDKTDDISNEMFLEEVFRKRPPDAHPIMVNFSGNPATTPNSSWIGEAWEDTPEQSFFFPGQHNNYFTCASYWPNDKGTYRRQKKYFNALHAVMLDDVGTKVDRDRLTLPPSWLLETSPGNYQAGYLLEAPLVDPSMADRLMKAVINANLCDPGADGPQTRLARLPVGVNGKHDPPDQRQLFFPSSDN
ncbi:RepB family DNA primase [bacterium]|nr:RepB family DNA primase [bacterium]